MGLSETILAAMIGAIATVSTACFQIFTAFKGNKKAAEAAGARQKKGSTFKSLLWVLALMIASAGGGFLYSEFLKEKKGEDIRAMREELKELKNDLRLTAQIRDSGSTPSIHEAQSSSMASVTPASLNSSSTQTESVAYVPACRRVGASTTDGVACAEADAQRIALCGTIPAYSRVDRIDLFAQPDAAQYGWDQHRVTVEQDVGGARFTGSSFEYKQGADAKAVCVNFMQWSSDHPHIARIVVKYAFGTAPSAMGPPAPEVAPAPSTTPAVIAETHAASLVTPAEN
jgi:hypothetical protein